MNHIILRRSELISIAVALLMLLAIGIFSGLDWIEYRQSRSEVVARRQIFETTGRLLLAVTDAETGQRGYMLTGEHAYLAPYQQAVSAIPADLDNLSRSVSEDAQRDKVAQLRSLVQAKLDELSHTIEIRQSGDIEGALSSVRSGPGAELMASIRRVAGQIEANEGALIATRSQQVRSRSDRAHLIVLLGSAALLIILALGAYNISSAANRREELIADLEKQRGQTAEVRDLLQTTLASIGDAVLVTDAAGRVTFMNRIAESLTGWKADEAAGKPEAEVFSIVDESTGAPAESPVQSVLRSGETFALPSPTILTTKDGAEIPIDDSGAPIRSHSGAMLGVVMVFRDVSSRRGAERDREELLAEARQSRAEAEQQRSHLHSLFQQAPAIINIHRGPDHIYEMVHPLMRALLGGRDVTGLTAREGLPNPDYVAILDDVYASGESRSVIEMPVSYAGPADPDRNRTRYLNYICCPWRDPGGAVAGVMTLAIDVTDQVLVRRAMNATQEQLRETAKLESLGVLAGGIAHDFNNLLVGIIGNASLALETIADDDPVQAMIGDVLRAGERAATLTRQMLAYSGKGRFVIERVDISTMAEEMLPLISGSIPKTVALRTHLAKNLPPVEADASQLHQVFMNLVINAAEACDSGGGLVTIVTRLQNVDESYIRATVLHGELTTGHYIVLEVTDDGCGMDEATRAKIFDPFFTTKFTGRGLGLSAVLGIIRSHKGSIKVYSEQGRGSTFRVLLPAALARMEPGSLAAGPVHKALARGTVLIVDDEDIVRRMAKASLEQLGYRVIDAGDGVQALDAFRAHRPEIDLVILDLTMPLMSGQETLVKIRQIDPHIPIILSSGFSESEATRHFEGKGLAGFLQKPYTISHLSERVRSVLALK